MLSLNERFNELADKYGVVDYSYDLPEYLYDKYKEELLNVYNAIDESTPIAFYGLGLSAVETFKILKGCPKKNIVCLVDSNAYYKEFCKDYDYLNIPIIYPEEIKNYKIEKIFVTPYGAEIKILEYLRNNYPGIEAVSIYENLMAKGYKYYSPFYGVWQHSSVYYRFFKEVILSNYSGRPIEEQRNTLKRLISMCLKYKDFVSARIFSNKYIENNYEDSVSYSDFWRELESLFSEARSAVKNKNNKNINIFIIDSLTNEEAKNINTLMKLSKKGLHFRNAYSTSSSTKSSVSSFLSGKYFYKDGSYFIYQDIMNMPSPFNELKENYRISSNSKYIDVFDKLEKKELNHKTNIGLTYWSYLDEYLKTDTDTIYVVHSSTESHPAFYNAGITDTRFCCEDWAMERDAFCGKGREAGVTNKTLDYSFDDYLKQQKDGSAYINGQLEFYTDFFVNENDMFVFMGDHGVCPKNEYGIAGRTYTPTWRYEKANFTPFLLVISRNVAPRAIDKMFSYIDFGDLLLNIHNSNVKLSNYERDYVICENLPIYNGTTPIVLSRLGMYDAMDGGIIIFTETEKYIKLVSGKEEFYLLQNEDKEANLINDKRYEQRIDFFRDILKDINLQDVYRKQEYAKYLKYIPKNMGGAL